MSDADLEYFLVMAIAAAGIAGKISCPKGIPADQFQRVRDKLTRDAAKDEMQ